MGKDRTNREKEWHNAYFKSDVRVKTRKFYSISGPMRKKWNERIVNGLQREQTVFLDYGCGSGYSLISISNNINRGVGIDISEVCIKWAKQTVEEKKIRNLDFFVMDAMNTVFKNEEFDVIRGIAILHHLDLKKSLEEVKRILKPGGKAFFFEPLDTNLIIKMYRKMTPEARTVDEQPLRKKDIKLIKSLFPKTEIRYYFFLSLLAVPFRNHKVFPRILQILFFMDRILLSKNSPVKWLGWCCTIEMMKG